MKTRKLKGFTLIELLVVIAIIGILAAATLVILGNVQQRAYDSNAFSAMKTIQSVATVCLLDGGTLAPISGYAGHLICNNDPALTTEKWPDLRSTTVKGGWGYNIARVGYGYDGLTPHAGFGNSFKFYLHGSDNFILEMTSNKSFKKIHCEASGCSMN